jgi:molybdate transport system regulatory protein
MTDGQEERTEPLAETRLEIALHFSNGARLGPDELRVVAAIRRQRSILGAGRATGLSYRTCWLIVDALNRAFEQPVIATHPGRRGGGAELTPFGERLVAVYASIERRARAQARPALGEIAAALNPSFRRRASDAAPEGAKLEDAPRKSQGS